MLRTYQTKIKTDNTEYLDEVASFFGLIQRKLFVDLYIHNKNKNQCKVDYLKQYNITSRQYNSILFVLDGKIKSYQEKTKYDIEQLEEKIKSIKDKLDKQNYEKEKLFLRISNNKKQNEIQFKKDTKKYNKIKFIIHHKKRKLHHLTDKLNKLKKDVNENKLRICFGSRKLFNKQHHLKENKYKNFNEWKLDWVKARNSTIYCIGSKDERSGNQTCTYTTLNNQLRLRVANQFINKYGKYIIFDHISFPYGQADINKALEVYIGKTQGKLNRTIKYCKSAISYRFIRREKGWYIHASVDVDIPDTNTRRALGCIGVDLNANFVSLCEIDRFGNPINEKKIKMNCYNRNSDQVKANIGDIVKEIVNYSLLTNKPISIEKLDFSRKKSTLGEQSKKYSRMLSGLTYNKFYEMLHSRAQKYGVEIIEVNPAYTSIIGQFKYMKRYGLSSHGSAACVIARRGSGYRIEKIKQNKLLNNYKDNLHKLSRFKQWSMVSKYVKKNYKYKERIKLLLAN